MALPKQEWRVALDVRRVALIAVVCSVPCAVVIAQTPDTAAVKIRLKDAIGAAQRNSPQAIQAHGQIRPRLRKSAQATRRSCRTYLSE